jgi:hypothetical protein
MNRLSLAVVLATATASTAGCPVYSNDRTHQVCGSQGCLDCADPAFSSSCAPSQCETSFDCPNGYACTLGGQCVSQGAGPLSGPGGSCATPSECEGGLTCGADNFCHTGDCGGGIGCPAGYACTLVDGLAQCLGSPPDGGDAGDAQSLEASASASEGATAEASSSPGDATMLEAAIIDGGTCVDGSCQ